MINLLKKIIRMHTRFIIRKARLNRTGTCPLNCRITVDGVKANEFAVGILVEPSKWDSAYQRIRGNSERTLDLNRKLDLIKSELDEIYLAGRAKGQRLSAHDIKDIYSGKKELSCRISTMIENFMIDLKLRERSKATLDRYGRCFKYLLTYIKSDLPADHVERRHISGFWNWLKSKDYHNDYCNKIVQACIGLFRYGIREGIVEKNPFTGTSLEWKKELDTTFLTSEEIEKLKKETWSERLQKVVDTFLFMCYTGLHISDYINAVEDSRYIYENKEWMQIRRVKTNVTAKFPLHKYVLYLLEKYGGISGLPRISGQKMNDYLKLVGEQIKTTKNLTNKIARKTFTNIALNEYKMSFESVGKMLGHVGINQIKHYGAISEKRIAAEWGDN